MLHLQVTSFHNEMYPEYMKYLVHIGTNFTEILRKIQPEDKFTANFHFATLSVPEA